MGKELRYRIVCPLCGKGFDSRTGTRMEGKWHGIVICPDCLKTLKVAVGGLQMTSSTLEEEEKSQDKKEEIQ